MIPKEWTDLNSLTGIPVGTEILLQNTGVANDVIQAAISDLMPSGDFRGVFIKQLTPMYRVTSGEGRVWVRLYRYDSEFNRLREAPLQVQVA